MEAEEKSRISEFQRQGLQYAGSGKEDCGMKYFNNKQQMYKRNKVLNRRDADNLIVASHKLFMMIGCLALNQAFDFGEKRVGRFVDKCQDILDLYNRGYISLEDIETMAERRHRN